MSIQHAPIEQVLSSKLIYVRSRDRQDKANTTSTNFRVDLGTASEIHKVKRVVLRAAHFPNTQYNVRAGINDTLVWTHNAIQYSATMTAGFYNIAQMITEVQTKMDAQMVGVPATATITQSATTQNLSISWSVNDGFIEATDTNVLSTFAATIGFITTRATAQPYLSDRPPSLFGLTRVILSSNELSPANSVNSEQQFSNALLNIPVEVPHNFMNHYEPTDDELASINYKTPKDIRFIDIQLTGQDGEEVDLRGYETEFWFKIYI